MLPIKPPKTHHSSVNGTSVASQQPIYSNISLSSLRTSFSLLFNLVLLCSSLDSLHTGSREKPILFLLQIPLLQTKPPQFCPSFPGGPGCKIQDRSHCTFLDPSQFVHIFRCSKLHMALNPHFKQYWAEVKYYSCASQ